MNPLHADPLLQQAVAEFGRGLGLEALALDDDGRAAMRLQSGTVMQLLLVDDELLLLIDCPLAFEGPELLERALVAANLKRGGPLQLGLRGRGADQVLQLARRLPWRRARGTDIARGFEQLLQHFESLRTATPAGATAPWAAGLRP